MSVGPLSGYTGFCSRTSEVHQLQPGVPDVCRDKKYRTLRQEAHQTAKMTQGPNAGNYICPGNHQASETMRSTMNVTSSDYKPPEKSRHLRRLPMDKPFLHNTTQRSFMVDCAKEQKDLSDMNDERLETAFQIVDETNTGAIDPIEIRPVLFELMGHEPSENEYRAFHAYCEPNELGVITFEEWMNGARKALDYLKKETKISVERCKQPWEKTRQREREVLGDPRRVSTFNSDYGFYGDDPKKRPIMEPNGKALNSTTKDLFEGSTKRGFQTPGYTGFIPSANNTKAYEIGRGEQPRNTFLMKTNLKDTFTRRVPGFTGHVETETENESLVVQKHHGYFAPTEQQAADSLVENYWKCQSKATRSKAHK